MKGILTSFFILVASFGFTQSGVDYSLNLTAIENLNDQQNIAFQNNLLVKNKKNKDLRLSTREIELVNQVANNPFIALNAALTPAPANPNVSLWVQFKSNKLWSDWIAIKQDAHTNSFEQVYIENEAQAIRFKIEERTDANISLASLDYRLYYPGETVSTQTEQGQAQHKDVSCSCPLPAVQYRNDWCPSGNCPKDLTPTATVVSHLVVHHSAGSNTSPDWAATVRAIWDFHTNTNGWDDIGYNFLIDPNGLIYEGRGNDVSGAHFSCMNAGTMGVCLLGNYSLAAPSTEMINSLTELLGWKVCDIDEDPRDTSYFATGAVDLVNLCGHRDGNSIPASCTVTECPGNNVYAIMDNLRSSVYDYSQTCTLSPNYSNIVVLEMGSTPLVIVEDEQVDLNVSFKNIGDAAINESLLVDYQIDGQSIGSTTFNSLAINETRTQSVPYIFNSPGIANFCTYIDAASNEINASNNSFCVAVQVLEKVDTSVTAIRHPNQLAFKVYPNPTKDLIYIESTSAFAEVIVHNGLGQVVLREKASPLSLANLNTGVYSLSIISSDGRQVQNLRVLKQ